MQADFSPITEAANTAILEMAIIAFIVFSLLAILAIIFERIVNKLVNTFKQKSKNKHAKKIKHKK